MALRIWLPLNGNDTNQGTSGTSASTVTAGSFATGGKVTAKCMQNGVRSIPYTYASTNRFSVALWVKPNSATAWTDMFGWGTGASRIEICANSGTEYRYYNSSGQGLISSGTVISSSIANGAWFHFAMVADGNTVKFYKDGTLVKSASQTATISATFDTTNTIWVGGYNGRGTFNSYINDFRVYDHAMSVKEVKELAMGMVAHYPMDGLGCDAMPNLLTWTKNYTSATPYNHTSASKDGYVIHSESLTTVTPNTVYYLSLKSTGIPGSHDTSGSAVTNKFTVWFYLRITGTTKSVGGYDSAICFSSSGAYINDQKNGIYVWKWTAPSNAQDVVIRTNSYSDGSTSVTIKFWDFKIEKGVYTHYVPGPNQSQYTALGLNSTRLADVTGHGYDLTWSSATPTVVSGSPRYMTANDFNAARYAVCSTMPLSMAAFTIAFWFKPRTMANQHFILGTFDSWQANGIGIYRDKANPTWFNIRMRSSSQGSDCSFGGQQFTLDTWHFMVITWDNANAKVYLDGTLKTTTAYAGGTCEFKNLFLGNSAYSSTSASETEEAAMSDFRLYATALTADNVTELYKAPVSFTKNGEVHACCISENTGAANPEVKKDGVVEAVAFSEVYGRYDNSVRIEPDGSAWMRMVHHADPASGNLFASSDSFATSVYKDAKRWFHGKICDYTNRWEFMIEQKANSSASTLKFRWVQPVNPNTAAYADVAAASITKNTSTGYTSFSHGGLYKKNANAYYTTNNGTQSNWWGAVGAWANTTNGIPAWNGTEVGTGGFEDLYIRMDGGATWSWPSNDRVSIIKTDKSVTEYGIVEI